MRIIVTCTQSRHRTKQICALMTKIKHWNVFIRKPEVMRVEACSWRHNQIIHNLLL